MIQLNGRRHHFTTRTSNKNTARSIEAAKRTELVKGIAGLSAPTLEEFSARFINSLPGRVSKQTYRFYIHHWMPLLAFPALCDCRLDRINPAVVEDFVQWRRKQKGRVGNISAVTVNHNLRTLRRALHFGGRMECDHEGSENHVADRRTPTRLRSQR
jgi:hypothetical protein